MPRWTATARPSYAGAHWQVGECPIAAIERLRALLDYTPSPGTPEGPWLETERLILRPQDIVADLEASAQTYADADTMRYLSGSPLSRAQSWRTLALQIGHHHVRGYSFLACIDKATGAWVGRVGPWYPEGWPAPEIGWALHPDHRGRGYATEAARACLDHVRGELGWTSLVHVIADGNVGSVGVAERLGSTRLYAIDGIPGVSDMPCHVYGQDL